jgi:hypothetical protein
MLLNATAPMMQAADYQLSSSGLHSRAAANTQGTIR